MAHLDQLLALFIGQVPPDQTRVLLVEGSSEEPEVVAHLGPDHEVVILVVELEHQRLLSEGLQHFRRPAETVPRRITTATFLKITAIIFKN